MQLRFFATACALAILPTAAAAQPADSFPDLVDRIEIQEDVEVIYAGLNRVVQGRAVAVSPSSLTVLAGGAPIELDAERVLRVRQRWEDPTRDGGLKGFAVGAAAYATWYLLEWNYLGQGVSTLPLVIFGAGGYLIGASIDAGRRENRIIYRAPARRPRAVVAPLLSKDRAGAALSITW